MKTIGKPGAKLLNRVVRGVYELTYQPGYTSATHTSEWVDKLNRFILVLECLHEVQFRIDWSLPEAEEETRLKRWASIIARGLSADRQRLYMVSCHKCERIPHPRTNRKAFEEIYKRRFRAYKEKETEDELV